MCQHEQKRSHSQQFIDQIYLYYASAPAEVTCILFCYTLKTAHARMYLGTSKHQPSIIHRYLS